MPWHGLTECEGICTRCREATTPHCPDPRCPVIERERARIGSRRRGDGQEIRAATRMNASADVFSDERKRRQQERKRPPRKGAEYAMQIRIAAWLHHALPAGGGTWWGAWDGGFSSARAAFFRRLRGVKAGTPDLCFVRNGRAYWVELKFSEKTKPSKVQRRVFAALEAAGCRSAVCRSGEEVEAMLRRWRFPLVCRYRDDFKIPPELTRQPRRRLTELGARRGTNRFRRTLGLPPLEPQNKREASRQLKAENGKAARMAGAGG